MKYELFKVLCLIITAFPGSLLFQHNLPKFEKAATEPLPSHTLVNRFTNIIHRSVTRGSEVRLTFELIKRQDHEENFGKCVRKNHALVIDI